MDISTQAATMTLPRLTEQDCQRCYLEWIEEANNEEQLREVAQVYFEGNLRTTWRRIECDPAS